jgi:hypothetical protein
MTLYAQTTGVIVSLVLVAHALAHEELFHVPPPPHPHVEIAQADMTARQVIAQEETGSGPIRSDQAHPGDWPWPGFTMLVS